MWAAVLIVATTLFVVAPAERAAAAGPVRGLQFNFCGAMCNYGVIDKPGSDNDVVEDIYNRILALRPHVVALNEACSAQITRLKNMLQASPWPMDGVFRPQRHDNRCRKGTGFGDAVLSSGGVGGVETLWLPNGEENRAVLCIRTTAGGPVLLCVLHLVTDDPLKGRQLAAATAAANRRAATGAVILGGDFNVGPWRMGGLTDPAQGGRFIDVDPEAALTRGKQKIDYLLFSRAHFINPSGGPARSAYSDHQALSGQATRR